VDVQGYPAEYERAIQLNEALAF